jgi:hypothetical protein
MQKDFVTATPDTGSSGTTTVNVTAAANIGEARNTAINVSGSSISKTVQVSQEEGLVRVSLKLMFDFIGANASNYTVQKTGNNWQVAANFRGSELPSGGTLIWAVEGVDDVRPQPTWSISSKFMKVTILNAMGVTPVVIDCAKYETLYTPTILGGIISITDISDEDKNTLAQELVKAIRRGGFVSVELSTTGSAPNFSVDYSIT